MAQIRGQVIRRIEGDEAWTIIGRISHKYLGAPYPREQARVVSWCDPSTVQSVASE